MNDTQAKNIMSSVRSRQKIVGVLASIIALIFLVVLTSNVMQQTQKNLSTATAPRTVANIGWTYSIDPVLETKFKITVKADARGVVQIGGTGCNAMSSRVVEDDGAKLDATHRDIRGKTYRLDVGVSTMMACTGSASDYDSQLSAEINNVFQSLQ